MIFFYIRTNVKQPSFISLSVYIYVVHLNMFTSTSNRAEALLCFSHIFCPVDTVKVFAEGDELN